MLFACRAARQSEHVRIRVAAKGSAAIGREGADGGRCRRYGVDLRAALGQAGEREIGGITGAVGDGRRVEIDGGGGEGRGVLPGADGVAEGERIGAGAAAVGGGAAVVERQRRHATCHRHRFAQIQGQRNGLTGIKVAAGWRFHQRRHSRRKGVERKGVDLRAALGQAGEREIGGVAGAVSDGRRVEIDGGGGEGKRILAGADGVAEGQSVGAGASGVGGSATVVEGQRRRATCHRHRFAQIQGQRNGLAGIEFAAGGRFHQRRNSRRKGVDLRAALGQAGEREVGGIAGAVGDGRRVEIDGGGGEGRRVLPGADGVAEGQRVGAGAAGVGGGAAVVEGQRRRAARHRHRLAQVERQRDGLAGIEVAARGRFRQRCDRRRGGVDLRAALRQAGERQVGGIAGTVRNGGAVEIDRRLHQVGRVLPGERRCS